MNWTRGIWVQMESLNMSVNLKVTHHLVKTCSKCFASGLRIWNRRALCWHSRKWECIPSLSYASEGTCNKNTSSKLVRDDITVNSYLSSWACVSQQVQMTLESGLMNSCKSLTHLTHAFQRLLNCCSLSKSNQNHTKSLHIAHQNPTIQNILSYPIVCKDLFV